ncbi:MAG: S8 family serine peptidase, partial [Holophagales bacterium]|nr:S8 family serine peptidase [Holophagales bacterium]
MVPEAPGGEPGRERQSPAGVGLALPSLERPAWMNRRVGDAQGRGVRVAVVDSGYIRPSGPPPAAEPTDLRALDGKVAPGRGLVETGGVRDRIGHGTACAHIVLSLAPAAEIVPVRVFDERLETSPEAIVAALGWAVEEGIDVVNLSLGSPSERAK